MSVDQSRHRFLLWLGGLWVAALAVRLVVVWEVSDSPLWLVVMGDARSYDAWADRLAAGDWLGDHVFYQAPLYPYFLGAVKATFGTGPWMPRVIQCLLGATGCVLLAVAGARLVSPRVGISAGAMLAVYPPAIFFDGLIQKTAFTSFFVCGLLAVAARLARQPDSRRGWFLAGVTAGLLALLRENALILLVLAPLWVLWTFRRFGRSRFAWSAVFLAGAATVLLPVAARNRFVGGEWHLTTSQFGPNFYIGNHSGASGLYEPLRFDRGDPIFERIDATAIAEESTGRRLTPREVSRYWTQTTLAEIADAPLDWLTLLVRKLWFTYGAFEIMDTEDQYTYAEYSVLLATLMKFWHMGVLAPLAMFGAAMLLPRGAWRRRLAWPTLLIIGLTASLLLFFLLGRYRCPLVPPLMLFAAAGLWQAVRLARQRRLHAARRDDLGSRRRDESRPVVQTALALAAAVIVAVPVNVPSGSIEQSKSVTRANLGKHLFMAGYPSRQVHEQYDRAIALTPRNLLLRSNYARVLWEMNEPRAARAQLEEAVRQAPENAAVLIELGLLLRDLGKLELAADRMLAAIVAEPSATEPPYHLAITLLMQAERLDYAAASEQLHARSPFSAEAREAALARRQATDLRREAVSLLRQSLAIDDDSHAARAALDKTLATLGQRRTAAKFGAR